MWRTVLTDAVRNAAVPEEVETLDDFERRARLVVKHPTRYTGQVCEERVAVDEVHGVTIWIAVERRTSVTHRCRTPVAVITRRWWTRATESCCRQSLTLTAIN